MKQPPCCARFTSQLNHQKNNLRQLAQRAAFHDARGNSIEKMKVMIANTKAEIKVLEGLIEDHEAEHAESAVA